MSYKGDFTAGSTIDFMFTTRQASGAPTTLSGSPVISIYKNNSATESVSGVTLSVDFDSRTGLNQVHITTGSDATFYANGSSYSAVITTGTVNSISVVGEVVGYFKLSSGINVVSISANAITAASIATDAIGADELAMSAVTEIDSNIVFPTCSTNDMI